jgi:hypothetical protein
MIKGAAMTKNQSLFFRFLLFLAGAGIILFAFFLIKGNNELNRTDAFVLTSIGLMYLIFFIPFFFSSINIGNFSGKIPTLPLVWLGIILYMAVSVVIIILLAKACIISLSAAIIIQSVLLFLFFIDVYFAYFAGSHVVAVAAEEAEKQQFLVQIKSKAQVLQLSADRLPAEYENAQKILKRSLDDIKYIYPVDDHAGCDLELKILRSLDTLSELTGGISSGARPSALEPEAENLHMLVKERKLLRN